jgi:hypothetical protein
MKPMTGITICKEYGLNQAGTAKCRETNQDLLCSTGQSSSSSPMLKLTGA